jgi:hypothetical protein
VDGLIEREDVDAILSGIFDINASLTEVRRELRQIRRLLEDGDEEEEEEDDPDGHA